jgi:tRNA/tmRNA/rRNA uracil-C5-methylase (TrmA/RlmC/RlmD family)
MSVHSSGAVAVAAVAVMLAGCGGRAHLTEGHGTAVRAVQHGQAAVPAAKRTNAIEGLDSQEAAIIADSYRRSLAPKGEKVEEEPVIFVAPPQRGMARQALAPSVPKER